MSKTRRNIMIIGFILLIVLFIVPFFFLGAGSPFEGSLGNLFGGDLRETLFRDNTVALDELDTNCDRLPDDTFDVSDDCSISIDGEDEEVRFDSPRDLRLNMCWGTVSINMTNEAGKIEVTDGLVPTERNSESLTFNVFKEGDTELDIDCISGQCRMAINNTECPAQMPISRNNIGIESGNCSINAESRIFFRDVCNLLIDTTDFEDEDGNENPIFYDSANIPRVVAIDYCLGDIEIIGSPNEESEESSHSVFSSSVEENFTIFGSIIMPDDIQHWEFDIYGEDQTRIALECTLPPEASPTPDDFTGASSVLPACMVVISNADCFP